MKSIFKKQLAVIAAFAFMPLYSSVSWGQLTVETVGNTTTVTIDFDDFEAGGSPLIDIQDQYAFFGATFSFLPKPGQGDSFLTLYDTSTRGGKDPDLETPGTSNGNVDWDTKIFGHEHDNGEWGAGNVLIIQKNNKKNKAPNDWAKGGIIRVDFAVDVKIEAYGILDQDDGNDSEVDFMGFDTDYFLIDNDPIADFGNNGYREFIDPVYKMKDEVRRADFTFESSGALTGIRFSFDNREYQIPEPSTYGLIGAGILGLLIGIRRFRQRKKAA